MTYKSHFILLTIFTALRLRKELIAT